MSGIDPIHNGSFSLFQFVDHLDTVAVSVAQFIVARTKRCRDQVNLIAIGSTERQRKGQVAIA
jgi:hypothetical protein